MNKVYEKYFKTGNKSLNWEYIESLPEFAKLKTCEQNPKWHSEGNAWEHTKKCVEYAYAHFDECFPKELFVLRDHDNEFRNVILAVLFHDIGKGVTTEFFKGAWHAYNHEYAGEKITRRILWDLPVAAREKICACVRNHMKIQRLADSKNAFQEVIAMSRIWGVTWRELYFVELCDTYGSVPEDNEVFFASAKKMEYLWEIIKEMNCEDGRFGCKTLISYLFDRTMAGAKINWENPLKMQRIIVLFGLPGAGKNTFIDRFFKAGDNDEVLAARAERWAVVSRDDIRAELGYCKDGDKVVLSPEKEEEVTKVFNERLAKYVKEGKNVFINNINLKKKYRDDYKRVIAATGKEVVWDYKYVEAPSIESNFERRPTFPKKVLTDMQEAIEWPQPDEYYNLNYFKGDISITW